MAVTLFPVYKLKEEMSLEGSVTLGQLLPSLSLIMTMVMGRSSSDFITIMILASKDDENKTTDTIVTVLHSNS